MQAGDLVFCTTHGIMGWAIRFAQRRNQEVDWLTNHVAVLDAPSGDSWTIIQAQPRGVTNDALLTEVAIGGTFEVVALPRTVNREAFLDFQRSEVGKKYSKSSITSDALNMLLPEKLYFRWSDAVVCSGLVALGLMYGGFPAMKDVNDLYSITPAQVKRAVLGDTNDGTSNG